MFYTIQQKDLPIYDEDFYCPMSKIKVLFKTLEEKGKLQEEFRAKDLNSQDKVYFAGPTLAKLVRLGIIKKVGTRKENIELIDYYFGPKYFDQNGKEIREYELRKLPNGATITIKRPTKEIISTYDVYRLVHNCYDDFLSKMFNRFMTLTESL